MLSGLVDVLLGRSTRSSAIFSPFHIALLKLDQVDIYDFIQREQEHRHTRDMDEATVMLEEITLDAEAPEPPISPIPTNKNRQRRQNAKARAAASTSARKSCTPSPPPVAVAPTPTPILGTIRIPRNPPTASSSKIPSTPAVPTPAHTPPPYSAPSQSTPRVRSEAEKIRRSAYHTKLRERKCTTADAPRKAVTFHSMAKAIPLFTGLDISGLRTTLTHWLGIRRPKPERRPYTVSELVSEPHCMTYIDWDGWICRPLIDAQMRLFALLAGRPRRDNSKDTYQDAVDEVTQLFDDHSDAASGDGRRGNFPAVTVGKSYGGGQCCPGNLLNSKKNAAICDKFLASDGLRRIRMTLLHLAAPYLRYLFPIFLTVFAACTFNFGPNAVTFPHVDAANLAWGWCCVTAFGDFDPDLGGHLILWDLKLVIRFPPGSTIMIPSAILRHSNFTAGGLFRWVYNGNKSDAKFFEKATASKLDSREADRAERWENGLRMFTVWNEELGQFEERAE
ncbi:hypothetical protein C8J57DRAFT_1224870 [Mycena rebaudengoi]|nr:hypothetical protein C8J57DRAFT_1224870 [Mycena rebaudengoi]